jgi:tetratricopeptide (TPR) repeat protein
MAFYKRQWPKAVALWEKALKEDPADAQVKSDLSSLKTLLDKERRDVEMKDLVAQAEAYQQTGLYDRAAESWKEVLRRDPRRPGAAESLAASRAAAEKVRQLKRLDAMNEDAVTLYNQGKHLSAAELWLEALQLDPTYQKARVWLKLVGKKIERGEESAAEPAPRSAPAPAAAPTSESVTRAEQLYKQGLLAYAEGRLEDSVKLWRGALAANPSLKKAQEALRQGESEISLMAK